MTDTTDTEEDYHVPLPLDLDFLHENLMELARGLAVQDEVHKELVDTFSAFIEDFSALIVEQSEALNRIKAQSKLVVEQISEQIFKPMREAIEEHEGL